MSFLNRYSAFFLPLVFFIISLFTIYDYGMNWDSPIHFARGQAYLRYILTGKTNYDGQPKYCVNSGNLTASIDAQTGEICDRHRKIRVSEYESPLLDFNSWAAKAVYGHPAFSGLMLAISNNIFFKTLGWVEDINSYYLYSLFATFILALTVSIWTKQTFGIFASLVSVLVIYTFPLLAGEQHFNVKDPPMAAFFTLSLYLFYLSITKKKPIYLIWSALAGGASFGTKFNFIFAPFILLPWLIAYLNQRKILKEILSKKMLLSLILYPLLVFLVFFATWPALWPDPIKNVSEVIRYYREIGGSKCDHFYFTPLWFTDCTQLITIKNLLYTLPPFSILLFLLGSIVSLIKFKERKFVTILWLSFFFFTVLRVTLSLSSIYGGLRQIIEFIAPFSMIAGVGALFLRDFIVNFLIEVPLLKTFSKKNMTIAASILIIAGFIPISLNLIKLHPNENLYFNLFIGGFKGAAEKNYPGYGNTYGNAYMQGIKWLNQNMELNKKLALVSGLGQNISRGQLRGDIDYSNNYRSGFNQEGEYQILLIEGNDSLTETFRYKYLSFLNPAFDLKIEGISILKIWKNDKEHLKEATNFDNQLLQNINTRFLDTEVIIDLYDKKNLKALGIKSQDPECKNALVGTKISISSNGIQYLQKAEGINNFTDREIIGYDTDFVYLFPGDEAQYIKITPPTDYPCDLSIIDFSVFIFKNLYNLSK